METARRVRFAGVFFDFGGTLFSYQNLGRGFSLIPRVVNRIGIDAEPHEFGEAYRRASEEAYQEVGGRSYYLHRDLWGETYRRFARALGVELREPDLEWWLAAQRDLVTESFELREDCISTLRALRELGVTLSVVSNIDDDYLDPMIERAGLSEILPSWTSSEEARSCKPDPQIYHYACEKAGCSAADVLFVGDSREHDIAGAESVGMTTALISEDGLPAPGEGYREPGQPDHEIERLEELIRIVGD